MIMQVIVTVPLAVLKANMVNFTPVLSPRKKAAIQNLGAGLVEKVGILKCTECVYCQTILFIDCSEISHWILAEYGRQC